MYVNVQEPKGKFHQSICSCKNLITLQIT